MTDLWRKWGQPASLALALFLLGLTVWRSHYGIDFFNEAENAIRVLSSNQAVTGSTSVFSQEVTGAWSWLYRLLEPSFFAHDLGPILGLRLLQFAVVVCTVLLISFAFPSEVGLGSRCLFVSFLPCFIPGGIFGVSNLTTASVLWAGGTLVLLFLRQQVTAYRLWIFMFLLAGLALLEPLMMLILPLAPLGIVACRGEGTLSWRRKVQVLAIWVLVLAIWGGAFLLRDFNQFEFSLRLYIDALLNQGKTAGSMAAPEGLLIFVFMLALLLAMLVPARYFHGLFIALCLPFIAGGLLLPGASVEAIVLFLAPLALTHIWRLRGTVFTANALGFFTLWLLLGVILFGVAAGVQGIAIALLPVFAVFFLAGWYRQLQWTGLLSAVVFGLLLVISGFRSLPPGQSRFESLDVVGKGAWQGISTSRSQYLRLESWQKGLAEVPPLAKSVWVQGNFPGFYFMVAPKPFGFGYSEVVDSFARQKILRQIEDLAMAPDLVFEVKDSSFDLERRWEDRDDYILWTREEVESLPGKIWIKSSLVIHGE